MSKEPTIMDVIEALRWLQTAMARLYRHDRDIIAAETLRDNVATEVMSWDVTAEPFYSDSEEMK